MAATLPTFLSCRWTLTDPAGDGGWAVAFDLVPGGAGAWDRAEATLPHPVGTLAVTDAERAVLSAGTEAYPAALISNGTDLLRLSAPDRAGVRRGELSAAALRALAE